LDHKSYWKAWRNSSASKINFEDFSVEWATTVARFSLAGGSMARWVKVLNRTQGNNELVQARWCATYLCRMRGLMFRRSLPQGEGLLLVYKREGIVMAGITMWWVFFPLGVAWLDASGRVVDCTIAQPWKNYAPARPAQYILEAHPPILDAVEIGDTLEFVDVPKD
jgi:uncharacterized membrane protein (UPF0127 family)